MMLFAITRFSGVFGQKRVIVIVPATVLRADLTVVLPNRFSSIVFSSLVLLMSPPDPQRTGFAFHRTAEGRTITRTLTGSIGRLIEVAG